MIFNIVIVFLAFFENKELKKYLLRLNIKRHYILKYYYYICIDKPQKSNMKISQIILYVIIILSSLLQDDKLYAD